MKTSLFPLKKRAPHAVVHSQPMAPCTGRAQRDLYSRGPLPEHWHWIRPQERPPFPLSVKRRAQEPLPPPVLGASLEESFLFPCSRMILDTLVGNEATVTHGSFGWRFLLPDWRCQFSVLTNTKSESPCLHRSWFVFLCYVQTAPRWDISHRGMRWQRRTRSQKYQWHQMKKFPVSRTPYLMSKSMKGWIKNQESTARSAVLESISVTGDRLCMDFQIYWRCLCKRSTHMSSTREFFSSSKSGWQAILAGINVCSFLQLLLQLVTISIN